uniref:ATP synthase F0 subunit 6 n=1 Tax=Megalobenedenia derzhavini TaxID=3068300 RepID=A0AA49KQM3_9PLAT|nr:ATP synthase F0 subunit 6 [Megalobenedenia derzhavini]WLG31370.1 ATP synthase F0 subunit 6 [Megalobenedenia derzhavini]
MFSNNLVNFLLLNFTNVVSSLSLSYKNICLFIALFFLLLRMPYLYGVIGFLGLVITFVAPLFLSIFFARISGGLNIFFSSLLPPGTPLFIAPFVCLAESISYIVRPLVLIIRPFLNITIGTLGGASIGAMCISFKPLIFFLVALFLYEVFVATVHWFIVVNILGFSIDH